MRGRQQPTHHPFRAPYGKSCARRCAVCGRPTDSWSDRICDGCAATDGSHHHSQICSSLAESEHMRGAIEADAYALAEVAQ